MTAGSTDFFMVPNSVIDEAGLSAHEKAVFAVLARHRNKSTNECFPGLAKIMRLTPASKPTVIKAIRSLLEKGLISMRVEGEKHLQRHIYSFPDLQTGKARLPVEAMKTGKARLPVVVVERSKTGKNNTRKPVNDVDPNHISNKIEKKPSRKAREPDARAASFKEAIFTYFIHKNPGLGATTWDGSEAKQLQSTLAANPALDLQAFHDLLQNRGRSDVNHSDRPRKWIADVTRFTSPLDRFGIPKGVGHANKSYRSQTKGVGNLSAVAEFIGSGENCHGS